MLISKNADQIVFTEGENADDSINEVGIHNIIATKTTPWKTLNVKGRKVMTRRTIITYGDPRSPRHFELSQFKDK